MDSNKGTLIKERTFYYGFPNISPIKFGLAKSFGSPPVEVKSITINEFNYCPIFSTKTETGIVLSCDDFPCSFDISGSPSSEICHIFRDNGKFELPELSLPFKYVTKNKTITGLVKDYFNIPTQVINFNLKYKDGTEVNDYKDFLKLGTNLSSFDPLPTFYVKMIITFEYVIL